MPVLFLVEGVFWLGIVAIGGATLIILAALAFIVSGLLLVALPTNWVTKPLAGASALFGLVLTVYQVYMAATLSGTALGTLGLSSGAIFGLFALISIYLELATLAMRGDVMAAKKA